MEQNTPPVQNTAPVNPANTKMTNPPVATQNAAAPAKMVKVKALRDFNLSTVTRVDGPTGREGGVYEVSEADAEELCRKMEGCYSFGGEVMSGNAARHNLAKAVRV